MAFAVAIRPRLLITIVRCLVVFAVLSAAGSHQASAHGWERSKVATGKIEYRLPGPSQDSVRTCLIEGFGKEADAAGDKKDIKVFSQSVSFVLFCDLIMFVSCSCAFIRGYSVIRLCLHLFRRNSVV